MFEKILNFVRSAQVGSIAVDGVCGTNTVRAMENFFGCKKKTGYIWGQNASQKKYRPAVTAVKNNGGGSAVVWNMQRWCGLEPDGYWGPNTSGGLQRKLKELGYLSASETIDNVAGKKTIRALQECLNNNGKRKPVPTNIQEKICAVAKQIADSKQYHYKNWKSGDEKTHECPICNNLTGKYKGWNCIGYPFHCWKAAGIKCKCNCQVISNGAWDDMLKASDANALKIAKQRTGVQDIKVIRNGGKGIPSSMLQKGDICGYYNGMKWYHEVLYVGNGKVADSSSGNKDKLVTYGKDYKSSACKVAIRYIGK